MPWLSWPSWPSCSAVLQKVMTPLESLVYDIRYASFGVGCAFVQTDVVLSNGVQVVGGITSDVTKLTVYLHHVDDDAIGSREGYAPPLLNEELGLCLSSIPSFRSADISGWCHYVDHRQIHPNNRIKDFSGDTYTIGNAAESYYLYLFFHVYESSCKKPLRNIEVDVTATWSDGGESREPRRGLSGVEEMTKESERLTIARRDAELMIRRLEEATMTAIEGYEKRQEWEERLLAVEKRVKGEVKTPDVGSERAKRSYGTQVGAENAIVKILVEVQKFREEVERYREEEAEHRERVEAESRRRVEAESKKRMEIENEERERFREEIKQYRREQAEERMRIETERNFHRVGAENDRLETVVEVKKHGGVGFESRAKDMVVRQLIKSREDISRDQAKRGTTKKARDRPRAKKLHENVREEGGLPKTFPKAFDEAPRFAKGVLAGRIKEVVELQGAICSGGYEWEKGPWGRYDCKKRFRDPIHGDHVVQWLDLGL